LNLSCGPNGGGGAINGAGWPAGAGVTGTGGETAGGDVTTGGGAAAAGSPGITIMPCPVAGGGTVVRKNGFVVGCELRQPATTNAARTIAHRFIAHAPKCPTSRAGKDRRNAAGHAEAETCSIDPWNHGR
jgi:hypothetical protein